MTEQQNWGPQALGIVPLKHRKDIASCTLVSRDTQSMLGVSSVSKRCEGLFPWEHWNCFFQVISLVQHLAELFNTAISLVLI